jgi:hypothetical protein
VQGVDGPSYVLQVAGATIALGQVRLEADALVLWQDRSCPRAVVLERAVSSYHTARVVDEQECR